MLTGNSCLVIKESFVKPAGIAPEKGSIPMSRQRRVRKVPDGTGFQGTKVGNGYTPSGSGGTWGNDGTFFNDHPTGASPDQAE